LVIEGKAKREKSALGVLDIIYYMELYFAYPAFYIILSIKARPNYGNSNSRLLYRKVSYHVSTILE
jgi:hypothetical protein